MGLWEFLQVWRGRRAAAGIAASLLLHVLVVAALLWGGRLLPAVEQRRAKVGDSLIVELPKSEDRLAPGVPDAPATPPSPSGPPVAAVPRPSAGAATPPTPPTPRRELPAPRQVASAQRLPDPPRPAPRSVETPRPAARATEPAAETGTEPAAEPTPSVATPKVERVPPGPAGDQQVASLPPSGVPSAPPLPDMRSALRRGAGGKGGGRGGIEGEAVPLDSKDLRYSDYLEKVRQKIKANWGYPCVKNFSSRECEYLSAQLVVEFGILKNGELQFVDIIRSSGFEIYDAYAVNAIRLASPYSRVPPGMMEQMRAGSTGTVIVAKFNYIASDASLTNIR